MNRKYLLSEENMPKAWYNMIADLPVPLPPALHPGTLQPITASDLSPIFADELIKQEVSRERYIEIPPEVLDILRMWRPTPLKRAYRLEKALDTPAKIYYKDESVSPSGSHKLNTAVAQAYYNKKQGIETLATETGAGQWGSALSQACQFFGLNCRVYMVRISFDQKPHRKTLMRINGAEVIASPSNRTEVGRRLLAENPNTSGSLGMAISEAVEDTVTSKNTRYTLGSVLNHVLLHQTVIGEEAIKQMEMTGDVPDYVIGCCGGGSNFAGLGFSFLKEKFAGKNKAEIIAVEPAACPTLTRGLYAYDFGDTGCLTPLLKQYTLGHNFVPSGIHAGGLRYHGVATLVAVLHKEGLLKSEAYNQNEVFKSAIIFARAEGIIPAPESSHAIHSAVVKALECKESGQAKTILFNLSGHGHFDMSSYEAYCDGKLEDIPLPQEIIDQAEKCIPKVDQ